MTTSVVGVSPPSGRVRQGWGRASLTLGAGVGLSAAAIHLGPMFAQRLVEPGWSSAAIEAVFSLLIFGPLVVIALAGGALCGVNAAAPGRHVVTNLSLGALTGFAGVILTVACASVGGTLSEGAARGADITLLLLGGAVIAMQTGAEEIYFRGWMQPVLQRAWGAPVAITVTAIAFATLHVVGGARSPVTLVNLVLGGLMFGMLAWHGRGIAAAFGAHFAWNSVEQLVLGLDPNPGVGSFGALLDLELAGAQSWGGSEEGLNASLAMTIVLVVILLALGGFVAWKRRAGARPGRLVID